MSAYILCDDCDGARIRFGAKCATCDGHGRVLSVAARDALVHDVLGPRFGHRISEEMLAVLNDHREELAAWLLEKEILHTTGYSLSFPPAVYTGGYSRAEPRRPQVVRSREGAGPRWRLYTYNPGVR